MTQSDHPDHPDQTEQPVVLDLHGGLVAQWAHECGPAHVFVLLNNGTVQPGVFRSVKGAQARAAEILRAYQEQLEALTPGEREETEEVTDELVWVLERDQLKLRDGFLPMGEPHPCARYSDSSSFAIRAQILHP